MSESKNELEWETILASNRDSVSVSFNKSNLFINRQHQLFRLKDKVNSKIKVTKKYLKFNQRIQKRISRILQK
jgi:hypothetical protein